MTLGEILKNCEGEGQGIYTLLQLNSLYDVNNLTTWREDYGIDDLIKDFNDVIKVFQITQRFGTCINNNVSQKGFGSIVIRYQC